MDYIFSGFKNFLASRALFYLVVLMLLVRITLALFYIPLPQNIFFADVTKADLINLLNKDRQRLGLNTLSENSNLDKAAFLKAQDMVKKGYFAHYSPDGVTPWFWFSQVGYKYNYAGENLAIGFTDSKNVHSALLNSQSHRENLLNPNYKEVGMVVLQGFGENESIVVVQLFANPVKNTPLALNNTSGNKQPNERQEETVLENDIEDETTFNYQAVRENINSSNTEERVLSQSMRYSLSAPGNTGKNSLYLKFLNFVVYNGNGIFQSISYLLLALVSVYLVLFTIHAKNQKVIVARSLMILSIIAMSIVIGAELVSNLIPYYAVVL